MKNTPEEILELGEKLLKTGLYHAIEVTYYEDMQNIDTFEYNNAIRTIVNKYHPQVTVHISGFNLSEENMTLRSAILHEVENCSKYLKELGGNEMVVHSGRMGGGIHVPVQATNGDKATKEEIYNRAWKLTVEMFRLICGITKEYGITVYTENLNKDHVTVTMSNLNQLLDEINSDNLKIVFDIGHCNFTCGKIPEQVQEAGERLKHLHLHDNDGVGDLHLPLGEGNIDYKSFAQALKSIKYTGLYLMELNHCTTDNLMKSRELLLKCLV